MQFKLFALVTAALSVQQASAILSPQDVVMGIHKITDLSSDTNDVVTEIGKGNVIAIVPKAIKSFQGIVSAVMQTVPMLKTEAPKKEFAVSGQNDICDAFVDFVKIHQNLLNNLIGQKGLLSSTPFTAPIAAVLRIIEGGVDALAFALIDLVPTCAKDVRKGTDDLQGTIKKSIDTYSIKLPGPFGGIASGLTGGILSN